MAECTIGPCVREPTHTAVIRTGYGEYPVQYCDEHLAFVRKRVTRGYGVLLNVQPIEKEKPVTNENPGPYPEPPLTTNEEIAELRKGLTQQSEKIRRLESVARDSEQAARARDKRIAELEDETNNLEHVNADLKRDVRAADEAIGEYRATNARLKETLDAQRQKTDALVSALHVLADNAEDEGRQDLSEEVDVLLAERNLKPRKQEYTIEILVPTRLHLHVTARSMNHARMLYEAGDIDWHVADGEIQEDDIKILDISEGSL